MKIVALGDTHGRSIWKNVVEQEKDADLFVFIGDYFDSHDYTTEQQVNNFLDIIAFKLANPDKVIMLIGNHDLHYITGDNGTSGFQRVGCFQISPIINDHIHHLQMAYQHGQFLFSHAGISPDWLEQFGYAKNNGSILDFVNDLFTYKPNSFVFNGWEPTGDNVTQTPVWIRPRSLMSACYETLRTEYIQVVGHTQVTKIDIEGKATGGRYYFIDALGTAKEYLIIENNQTKLGKIL